jgi:hypothetical protein
MRKEHTEGAFLFPQMVATPGRKAAEDWKPPVKLSLDDHYNFISQWHTQSESKSNY